MDTITFEAVRSIDCIKDLRDKYLDNLIEPQELFLELKLAGSRIIVSKSGNNRIGYFILDSDNILWEYFIISEYLNSNDTILGEVIKEFQITKALCKSFDQDMLSCCMKYQKEVKPYGIHFRTYNKNSLPGFDKDISIRYPEMSDEEIIKEINEEIFDTDDQIPDYIQNKKMFIFEKDNEILGLGIFSRVIKDRPDFDIGMLVTKKYRRQGYGSLIIQYLAEYCHQNGWRPVCGCAIDNEASRKCLEKAGFTAGYRLLEFTF